jgi:hypothetical protein
MMTIFKQTNFLIYVMCRKVVEKKVVKTIYRPILLITDLILCEISCTSCEVHIPLGRGVYTPVTAVEMKERVGRNGSELSFFVLVKFRACACIRVCVCACVHVCM